MHVLVTGADGFIGSHLVEALLGWSEVDHLVAMVHRKQLRWLPTGFEPKLTFETVDIQRSSALDSLPDVDVIFHLAAISSAGRCENMPETARLTNFQGTVNLLNRALRMEPRPVFVFASTAALYGEAKYLPIDEDHPIEPRDQYTSSKLSSEITIVAYHREQGLPAVIVRPFNVYGPRQSTDFVVPTIVTQCLQGIQLRLGDGRPVRNFTFVTDAVNMLVRAGTVPGAVGRVINLGSREALPISRVAEMVVDMTGCGLEPVYDLGKYRDGDPTALEMDPSLAEGLLRWRPKVPMADGLRITIDHFEQEMERTARQAAADLYSRY